MARKCYISFKTEDIAYKVYIQTSLNVDMIDKSLNVPIQSHNEEYILRRIREDYLSDSTVTIHLIGAYSGEDRGAHEQRFIKRELQGSLYNSQASPRSGVLGVVLPDRVGTIFGPSYTCSTCSCQHNFVGLNDNTAIREFWRNYYTTDGKCSHAEDERYCGLASWDQFVAAPNDFIERAFAKRSAPVSAKVRVYG
jgi:hypothetical protein